MSEDNDNYEDKFLDIESRLLEQEHRPFTLIRNFFGRKRWTKDDPRRKAVKTALFWRILFSPGVVAATGGTLALLSLVVLIWQTVILIKQNSLITDQNTKINQQSYLIEAQRRSALQFEISEILNRIDDELNIDNKDRRLTPQLKSRIIAATIAMKTYRSFEGDSLQKPYSYEKGMLFAALLNSEISRNSLDEILSNGNFSGMILQDVNLGNPKNPIYIDDFEISDCYFEKVTFNNIEFVSTKWRKSVFKNCVFYGIKFGFLDLSDSQFFDTHFHLIPYEDSSNFDAALHFQNSSMNYCSFKTLGAKNTKLGFLIIGSNNFLKYSSIESVEMTFDYPGDSSSYELSNIILQDSTAAKIDLSGTYETAKINNIYIPEYLDARLDLEYFKESVLEASEINERTYDGYFGPIILELLYKQYDLKENFQE